MPSSEQVAWSIYGDLHDSDRRAVDAWRNLGNDLVTSLLNSGVLVPGGRRYPADDPADWNRRQLGTDRTLIHRETCEHEAAHAVVAHALGLDNIRAFVEKHDAGTTHFAGGTPHDKATVSIAAKVWLEEFRATVFPCGARGCSDDMQHLARDTRGDEFNRRVARLTAREILREQHDMVLAAADTLMRHGELTLARSGHGPDLGKLF